MPNFEKRSSIQFIIVILGIFILVYSVKVEGKRMCYTCDTGTSELECLYSPNNVSVGEFQKPCRHYCTIKRVEYINIPETVAIVSLKRDCEENPPRKDEVIAGDFFITFHRSCKSNLCNDGDGLKSLKDIPEEVDEEDDESSSHGVHYCSYRSMRILQIYFFAFFASLLSIR